MYVCLFFFFGLDGMINHGKYTLYVKHIYGDALASVLSVFFLINNV